jgi:flagellar motility protein MotE (MotC chaperone)
MDDKVKSMSSLEKKKAFLKKPIEERRKILKEQAEQFVKYNSDYVKEV